MNGVYRWLTGPELEAGDEVRVQSGKYAGQRGTIDQLTPQQAYVHLVPQGRVVRLFQSSLVRIG